MSDVLAAFLFAQLENWKPVQARRREIWEKYHSSLEDWARDQRVRLPIVPQYCQQAWHMFYLLMPSLSERQAFITHLQQRDISAVFHYLPLHLSAVGQRYGGKIGDCPVTEDISDRLVRLPFYNTLDETLQQRVIDAVLDYRPRSS
jgi:dTDP-4-amino-4,6-dideoxygalactose transaminase